MLDTLPVPPFESETKRAPINKTTAVVSSKQNQMPTVESGTSVAPRQRPKGSIQPSSHNLPIVAPPSPSPRNTLSSPVPPATATVNAPVTAIATATSNPQSAETTPQHFPNAEEPTFNAQFQANFPPVQAPVAVTPQYSSANNSQSNSITNVNQTDAAVADPNNLDSLFESKFPDPFRESVATGSATSSLATLTNIDTIAQQDVVMPLETVASTPTKSNIQQFLGAPKAAMVGHRRNVSDTSAFNKYVFDKRHWHRSPD